MTSTYNYDFSSVYVNDPQVRDYLKPQLEAIPWAKAPSPLFYIVNATVVDTANGKLMDGPQVITIDKGEIVSVEPAKSAKLEPNAEQYDVSGKFISPGLIDAHVHITAVPGVETLAEMAALPEQVIALRTPYVLKGMLERGFTTVRDCGGASKFIANAIEDGSILGPRLFQCGKAISQTGGHGDLVAPGYSGGDGEGCCRGHAVAYGRTADGVPAVLKAVREELKQGADFIKIMAGGGVSSETDAIDTIQYTSEELQAITRTAWQMGKKMCTAHAYTLEAIHHAIDNGVKGIEHGNLMDAATAQRMAKEGIYHTPTLACHGGTARAIATETYKRYIPNKGKGSTIMSQGIQALKISHDAGVTICYGSDFLISLHALQTEEFTVRATLLPSPAILKHATVNPAKMLKQEGRLGIIAPGAVADLIVLDRNPLEDITVLDRPELYLRAVFKEGRLVSGKI